MEPNKPTRRVFGVDAGLDWSEQLEQIRRASSKAVTRLLSMLDSAADGSEVAEIVRALSQAQLMAQRATGGDSPGAEPTDAQLIKATKS